GKAERDQPKDTPEIPLAPFGSPSWHGSLRAGNRPRSLPHDAEGPVPPRLGEEIEGDVAYLPHLTPIAGPRDGVLVIGEGPVHHEGPALDVALRHRAPVAGVVGVVAVVPHAEVAAGGHRRGAEVVAPAPRVEEEVARVGLAVLVVGERRVVHVAA